MPSVFKAIGSGGIPILCLHHISEIDYYTSVQPSMFQALVEDLGTRFHFFSCADVRRHLEFDIPFEAPPIVLTFDDGYSDNFAHLIAAAESSGLRATVFPVTDYIGRTNDWNSKAPYRAEHMTAQQLRTLAAHGFEIGSHTLDHVNLARHDRVELHRQLAESKLLLEDLLGSKVETVAYPYGTHTPDILAAAREYYMSGLTTASCQGGDSWLDSPLNLRRFSITRSTSQTDVNDAIGTWRIFQ